MMPKYLPAYIIVTTILATWEVIDILKVILS